MLPRRSGEAARDGAATHYSQLMSQICTLG
jgi:hypothetical protein